MRQGGGGGNRASPPHGPTGAVGGRGAERASLASLGATADVQARSRACIRMLTHGTAFELHNYVVGVTATGGEPLASAATGRTRRVSAAHILGEHVMSVRHKSMLTYI